MRLSNKQFQKLLTAMVKEFNKVQGNEYKLEFTSDEAATLGRNEGDGDVFYLTYIDELLSLRTLYGMSLWVKSENGKAVIKILNR